jgi:hypothetical protein
MSTIVLRSVKGTPLTNAEVDANFTNLNNDKTELGGTYSSGTASGVLFLNGSKVLTTGSALVFDGTNLGVGISPTSDGAIHVHRSGASFPTIKITNGTTGSGNLDGFDLLCGSGGEAYVFNRESQPLIFGVSNAEQMRLTSTGLGIGTSSPSKLLDVGGVFRVAVSANAADINGKSDNTGGLNLFGGGAFNTGAGIVIDGASSGTPNVIRFTRGAFVESMRLDSSGNLGLGVAPSAWSTLRGLQVGNASLAGFQNFAYLNSNAFYDGSAWKYISNGPAGKYDQVNSVHAWYTSASGTAGNAISFSQVMTLDASGNLGIGTSSPSEKLTVAGNVTIPSNNFYKMGTGNYLYSDGANTVELAAGTSGKLSFVTNGALRATLDSSGNLGLGITPSAWASNAKVFQVGATSSFVNSGAGDTSIGENRFFNGTNNIYLASTFASIYQQTTGQHRWFNAPSGTAGNAISFTQAMTLDASGRLAIGTTSPGSYNTSADDFVIAGSANVGMTIRASSGGANIVFSNAEDTGVDGLIQYDTSSNFMRFDTNGSERARITSDGNFSLGPSGGSGRSININSNQSTTGVFFYNDENQTVLASCAAVPMIFRTSNTERARIDSSGNLLVGTTSSISGYTDAYLHVATVNNGKRGLTVGNSSGTSATGCITFVNGNGQVGFILTDGSTTTYSTSSDYRLKNTIAPMTGALAKVALLKPCTYKWNADGSDGEGFIAHELAEVVPQCVTGQKDAVDAEGKPQYQGIDTSFLVATLTAAIQELKAEFDAYKASHP